MLVDAVAGDAFAQRADHRNAAGHGRFETQLLACARRELRERRSLMRDQLFVGGDHGAAAFERAAHPGAGRIAPADQLDDHVGVGREDVVDVVGPADVGGDPAAPSCARRRD